MKITYFKANYTEGTIKPIEAETRRKGKVGIGNSIYDDTEDIQTPYASYHRNYFKAKQALRDYLIKKAEITQHEMNKIQEQIRYVDTNY